MSPLPRIVRLVVDLALPPRCAGCGAVTEADHRFCVTCWQQLDFIGPPWCATCHIPFAYDRGPEAQCAVCMAEPPVHDGVRAAVGYDAIARRVALRLKYSGRMAYAQTMAQAMARLLPADADVLIPVPLHWRRLWRRGYNQAALIADALGKRSGVPANPHLLRRIRPTPLLRGFSAKGRAKTVAGAFALAPGARDQLRGRTVVLIDDVYTSGATASACARLLKRKGAAKVVVLCWARVLRPGSESGR